jgi:N-acetylglutamate synthase-like GNAT family acetyltransferase
VKLFALKCDGGYLKKAPSVIQCVPIEKATVVSESGLEEMESLAAAAKKAGITNIFLIELVVTEGQCLKRF